MKIINVCAIGTILLAGIATSAAQQTSIPLEQIPLVASVATQPSFSVGNAWTDSYSSSISDLLPPSEPLGVTIIRPVAPIAEHRVLDRKYYLLNGLHVGMGLLDVGLTQHCIKAHQCTEGNPLMPSSLAGQLSVNFAYVGYAAFFSYNLKKRHSRLWWISPVSGIATHTVGTTTGLMHY